VSAAATGRDLAHVTTGGIAATDGPLPAVGRALNECLGEVRNVGPGGESFPLVLDEPFLNCDPQIVGPLLETILEQSAHQQVLLLTDSAEIRSWAGLEAMTGALEVVEPMPATT